jgi:hypothetical protein
MRLLLVAACMTAAVALLPGRSHACSCELPPALTLEEAVQHAREGGLVYVGTVVAEDSTSHHEFRYYTLDVEHSIGGARSDTQRIATQLEGPSCGARLNVGARYLMLPVANPQTMEEMGAPSINLCWERRQAIQDAGFISQLLAATAVEGQGWAEVKSRVLPERGCSCSGVPSMVLTQ